VFTPKYNFAACLETNVKDRLFFYDTAIMEKMSFQLDLIRMASAVAQHERFAPAQVPAFTDALNQLANLPVGQTAAPTPTPVR